MERALWEIAAHGGNVQAACRSLAEQGIGRPDGQPIPYATLGDWKRKVFRNRYQEIVTTRVHDIDEVLAQHAQANALELGSGIGSALKVTLGGLSESSGLEASTILRNMAQARTMEIDNAAKLRGTDPASRNADTLERLVAELAGVAGTNVVKVREEDAETGVIDADFVHELPEEIQAEVDAVSVGLERKGPGGSGDHDESLGDDGDAERSGVGLSGA